MGKLRLLERIAVKGEVKIMRRIADAGGHPGIVALRDVVESESGSKGDMFVVMEVCGGGSLLDLLKHNGPLPEGAARVLLCQLADSLAFCHSQGILHRDIKPDNILLDKPAECLYSSCVSQGALSHRVRAKFADFGLACTVTEDGTTSGLAGSRHFTAPEMLRGERYRSTADIWSLGVMLCTMLTAKLPFCGATDEDEEGLRCAIMEGKVNFGAPMWEGISEEARDLVSWMLMLDPAKRPQASDILDHPWCTKADARGKHGNGSLPSTIREISDSFEKLVDMHREEVSPSMFSSCAAEAALSLFPALPVGPSPLPPCKDVGMHKEGNSASGSGGFEATASLWCLEHLNGNGVGCVACMAAQQHFEIEGVADPWVMTAVDAF